MAPLTTEDSPGAGLRRSNRRRHVAESLLASICVTEEGHEEALKVMAPELMDMIKLRQGLAAPPRGTRADLALSPAKPPASPPAVAAAAKPDPAAGTAAELRATFEEEEDDEGWADDDGAAAQGSEEWADEEAALAAEHS